MASNPLHISTSIPFEFELIAVPGDLTDLVNTFFSIRTEPGTIEETMPAYSAQVIVYSEGSGKLITEDGTTYLSETVSCMAPLMQAVPFTIEGPARLVGASLTPIGWQCLSGMPADEVNNCTVPASKVFGEKTIAELEELASNIGDNDAQRIAAAIGNALHDCRPNLKKRHAGFVSAVTGWLSSELNPDLEELYRRVAVSERTAQRLCRRYFGVSPSRLVKRYRAIRAAMLLANPELPQAMRDEILSAYFDQAHLIRDIRRYTGRTPRALKDESFVQDTLDPDAHGTAARILR
ncbi:helix-turn-helix transcriptional regulator [Erythrobacter sp. THAF29]|uniref:helix-turn-helix transcriptional regulator n=1 Tax=Erythrobacter sp. THAF29 TaxID=2587851 RepID=UPI0012AA992B|nr:helix-turn-helix transcriptional regulator [Erythrobacter sp. THAF29]QFT76412.1 Helix-turn-helix domain protein [Erythrobacter sp. THAF29]